ncbi:unnamed protein product, partial [Urochloa humidicola]
EVRAIDRCLAPAIAAAAGLPAPMLAGKPWGRSPRNQCKQVENSGHRGVPQMLHLTLQGQHGVAMVPHSLLEPVGFNLQIVVLPTEAIPDHHHKHGLCIKNCKHHALL